MTWALITGAAKGLGAAIAEGLAAKGFDVLVHHRSSSPSEVVERCRAHGRQAEAVQGDLGSQDGVHTFLQSLNKSVGLLVNNVGNYQVSSFEQTSMNEWQALYQTNFFAPIALIQGLLPNLKEQKGAVVNIGVAGVMRPDLHAPAYKLSKFNLWALNRTLARAFAKDGVRVNMVSPGQLEGSVDLSPEAPRGAVDLPSGRPATYAEVVQAVTFFADPTNHQITGQNLEVSGGYAL